MSIRPTTEDTDLLAENTPTETLQNKPIISIKTCLVFMVSLMILTTLIVTSIIWLSSFASTVEVMATDLTQQQTDYLVQHINSTLFEMTIASETLKSQMKVYLNQNLSDYDQLSEPLFNFIKSEVKLHPGLIEAVNMYNNLGYGNGFVTKLGPRPFLTNINRPTYNDLINCDFESNTLNCSSLYGRVPTSELGQILKRFASLNPEIPTFTPTFTSYGIPLNVIALVNSFKFENSSNEYDWSQNILISTDTLSRFLKTSTETIPGAVSMILESPTEKKVVATNFPREYITGLYTATIETIFSINNTEIKNVYNQVISQYPELMYSPCNTMVLKVNSEKRHSIFRICTDSKVDWVIIFSIPQWNYIGSMIIAIICALVGNVLILLLGSGLGMYSSIRITHPFYNLIGLFEMVSNMELDTLQVEPSRFKEVSQLQSHFLIMTKKINEYRSFIPAHLLASIDGNSKVEEPIEKSGTAKQYSDENSSIRESSKSLSSIAKHSTGQSSTSFRVDSNMFKLGLINKEITFMRLYFENLNELFGNLHDVSNTLSDIFSVLQSWANKSGCFMGNIENQSITFSWNSSFDCKHHSKKAADQTNLLIEKTSKLNSKINLRFCMLTGKCTVGNVGTEKMKNFTIFGNFNQNLDRMIQQTIKLNIPNLISESVYKENYQNFEFRYICEKKLVNDTEPFFSISDEGKKNCEMFQMGKHMKVNMDEWMYELEQMEKSKKEWSLYNQGVDLYVKKDYGQAIKLFQDHQAQFPQDLPTRKMIKKCEKHLK